MQPRNAILRVSRVFCYLCSRSTYKSNSKPLTSHWSPAKILLELTMSDLRGIKDAVITSLERTSIQCKFQFNSVFPINETLLYETSWTSAIFSEHSFLGSEIPSAILFDVASSLSSCHVFRFLTVDLLSPIIWRVNYENAVKISRWDLKIFLIQLIR